MADKQGTSYRLSPRGLALVAELAERLGVSHAGVIELSLRQTARWVDGVPPGELVADLAEVREIEPPPTKRPRGRPRKQREGE